MMTKTKIAILTAFFVVLSVIAQGATLTGPDTVNEGRIALFEADTDGDALLFPAEHTDLFKDSDKRRFYVATNIPGKYTLIFFAVEDGKPALCQKVFEVKALPRPSPSPDPDPKPPTPDVKLTEAEQDALIYALQSCCYHIEKQKLKTPAGIRASFKTAINEKIVTESAALSQKLDQLTKRTDWTDAQSVKTCFVGFLEELGEPWEGAEKTFSDVSIEDVLTNPPTICPGGTCPPVKYTY